MFSLIIFCLMVVGGYYYLLKSLDKDIEVNGFPIGVRNLGVELLIKNKSIYIVKDKEILTIQLAGVEPHRQEQEILCA